ncbi:MAG: hypothetical protein JNL67_10450 [Planctomycetaceae bacterium]|nr:hypothetical protein [Planctomycetaceae bacterium]
MKLKYLVAILMALVVNVVTNSGLGAQETDPAKKTEAEQQQESAQTEKVEELPDYKGSFHGLDQPNPTENAGNEDTDVVAEIEAKIKELDKKEKLDAEERAELVRLKNELKAAKLVRQQFKRAKPAKVERSPNDTYVIAKLEVLPNENVLDIRFESLQGEADSIRNVVDYVRQTPRHGYRDYRIVSRHAKETEAESALYEVREDYDKAKAQQEQYLQYIAQRQAELARIAAARRC